MILDDCADSCIKSSIVYSTGEWDAEIEIIKHPTVIRKTDLYLDWSGTSGRRKEENSKDHTMLKPAKGVSNDWAA